MSHLKQFQVSNDTPSVLRVTFDNPPINLLTMETIGELQQLMAAIEANRQLKVVVFDSANPDYFVAHFDVWGAAEALSQPVTHGGLGPWGDFTTRLSHSPVVSIAKVRGRARGVGDEFLLACDMRFASLERAIFCQPESAVGVVPGGGGAERLPLAVGRARALELLLGSDDIDAATAERYGLVNRALPDAELDAFVEKLVKRIASFEHRVLATIKNLVNRHTLPQQNDLAASLDLFRQSVGWEGASARAQLLARAGINRPGDFEMHLGARLGELMSEARDGAGKAA